MSHLTPGLIGAYNSLTDKHLTAYFNNARIRRHLQRVGLISRSGRIVSEKEFRYKVIHRDQQRHVRECLAQAIFHRVLDMERLHQTEIRRKLEEFSRRERVNKMKVERCNRYEDDPLIFLSPRPPTRLRNSHAQHSGPEREPSDSTDSLGSSRPNTAPEKTQRPVRLKPLNSSTPTSTKRNSSRCQNHDSTNDREQPISCILDRDVMRHLTLTDFSSSVSPYRLPVINNFVTPVPPLKRKDKLQNGTLRGRRLRPTTAPSDAPDTKEGAVQRAWSRSAVWVKMVYFGKSVHLSHDLMELKDEVKVFQQHCGGENLCVYKGKLKEGESFQFVSRRHRGFPFSLTFYLNGLQVERLSSCCEFKHRKNSRLGGRHAHFGFSGVEGAAPCYRCIIAMGLDKKPTPPKRMRNDLLVSKSWEKEKEEENHSKSESSQSHDTETKRNTNQEHKHKNGYEEDFEADDEGPMEDGVDEGNETSPSLSREEEDKRRKDENGSDNLNRNKVRGSSSVSSGLSSSSSSSEENEDELDEEQKEAELKPKRHMATLTSEKDAEETEDLQTSSVSLPTENETQNRETEQTERVDGETEEPREAEEPTDAPVEAEEPREEPGEAEKPREDLRAGTAGDVNKEGDRAKSVQEKLAAAILNMTECVSEPELSDTTTEEDELVSVVSQREGPGAEPENNVAQLTGDEENGSEPVQEAEREEAHTEEPKEEIKKEIHETPQPETIKEEEEKDTNQTEGKIQNASNEDESVQDEQNSGDEKEDQKPEVKQDTTDEEEGQKQENNNFTNEENKSNEEPEMMKEPEDEELPDGEVPKSEESFGQKPEKEATSENAEETRATPVEEEVNMIEEITELQLENPEETSMNHENVDQNTVKERINDEEPNGGEEVSADDKVTEEVRADDEETFDEESRNRRNNSEETGNYITDCVEGIMEDTELELKGSAINEVNSEDVASEDKKSEERLVVFVTEGEKEQREDGGGVETDVTDGMEETKDQDPQVKEDENTDEGNKDEEKIDKEMTEDNADQKEPTPPGQTSEEKAEDDVGKREEEKEALAAEKDAELKDRGDDKHTEELKEKESLKETEVGENEVDDMSDGGEERTDVAGADAEMQKIVTEQEDDNKEEQKDNADPTVHEALQETTDGPDIKSGEIKAENGEETINVDQEEPDKKEEAGPGEGEGTSETNEEEINRDMTKEEGVKDEEMDDDNEKEQDQRVIQQETTNEEEEDEKEEEDVGEEEIEQKQNVQQETTNEEEVKDEQKDELENIKPLISENSNDAATEDEAPSDTKTPAEDPAGAESEPKDTNVDLESRGEEESRAGDGNHIQSSTDIKKDKSADAAKETRSVEGSTSPSEESQPLEKVLAFKREEREAELIVAPRTDHEELVSNWVNVHQASNYFETFVEPLDEIKVLDREMTVNAEALEIDETILSPKESHRNEESSETDKISLPVNSEREELEDTVVENFNMESEALGAEGQTNPFSSNSAEEEEDRRQMDSVQTPKDQEDVAVNNVMNISATPVMKIEISQDS
ncbi:glutamate-rich protein 3 isoform X2 [Ictalurus furcatus]|uniref:glutamate-rich protein 3 isoform X2 n=1 Tax=Ictalurus furcatus TaxID=66913 RepID=UPI00235015C2|nr:glutamate-rich protein 3 isoform X2 [Ictalurus furcatus]